MTFSIRPVPSALRPVVLAARLASSEAMPGTLSRVLAAFNPPIDPVSPEWAALCAALDRYDTAQDDIGLDAARKQVIIAAEILLAGSTGPDFADLHRVPVQRKPPKEHHA